MCILPGLLDLTSSVATNAIFALAAMALDLSYIIPIFLYEYPCFLIFGSHHYSRRRVYANHPEVQFKPGPFYMGTGVVGWTANITCISWTLFMSVIFSLPTILPVTRENMNYASVITIGVVVVSG